MRVTAFWKVSALCLAFALANVAGLNSGSRFVDGSAQAAGPASVADLADSLIGAVVNISTSQNVRGPEGQSGLPRPRVPEGSPFQDFFDEFFRQQEQGNGAPVTNTQLTSKCRTLWIYAALQIV